MIDLRHNAILRHITLDDCTFDPLSGFPAIYSAYMKALEIEQINPMTGEDMSASDITKVQIHC